MKVLIKDCLKLKAFRDAKVVSGNDKILEQIKKVTLLAGESPREALLQWGGPNHLAIIGFGEIKKDTDLQCELLRSLSQSGTVALAIFYVEDDLVELEKYIIKEAKKEDIVLILVPKKAENNLSQAVEEIYTILFYGNKESFENQLITNTIYHLLNFDMYIDFQTALRAAALNNNFQMVLLSEDFNPVLSIETRHKTTIDRAIRLGREKDMKGKNVYTLVDVDGVLTYWGPVNIDNTTYYMFIVDNEDSYSTAEMTKLAEIIQLSMGMWKFTPLRDSKAEFIKALKRGSITTAYSAREDANIDEENIASVFMIKGFKLLDTQRKIDDYCNRYNVNVFTITEGEFVYGILLGELSQLDILELYDGLKIDRDLRIFHVSGIENLEEAADGYRIINETWSYAEAVYPYKRVFSKYELALVNNCVNIYSQGGFLKKNYYKLIEPLGIEGCNKSKQLLETLECFILDAGFNSTKTSEIMDVHVNTVQYRIKKISEVLGAEIMGNRIVPGMTVSLALHRLERFALGGQSDVISL